MRLKFLKACHERCVWIIFNFLTCVLLTSTCTRARKRGDFGCSTGAARRWRRHSPFRSLVPKCCVRCPLLVDRGIFSFVGSISIWKGVQIDSHSRSSSSQSLKIRFEPVSRANNRRQVYDSLVNIRHKMTLFTRGH
jgi:hypothetical protein